MVGSFVSSKMGHDKNNIYIVIDEANDYLFLADGRLKSVDNPKKKKRKHVQPINIYIEESLLEALKNKSLTNEQIKYQIKEYLNKREK